MAIAFAIPMLRLAFDQYLWDRSAIIPVLIAGFALACGGVPGERDGTVDTGIVILDEFRTIRAELARELGDTVPGNPGELIDVVGIAMLPGGIAVADRGADNIKIFGRDGHHVATLGRTGSGPGEFRQLSWIDYANSGHLVTFDATLNRFTAFELNGAIVNEHQPALASDYAYVRPLGTFDDGSIFAVASGDYDLRTNLGLARAGAEFMKLWLGDGSTRNIAALPGDEWLNYQGVAAFGRMRPPFARSGLAVPIQNDWYYVDSEQSSLIKFNSSGDTIDEVVLPINRRPLTPRSARALMEDAIMSYPEDQRPRIRSVLHGVPIHTTPPVAVELLADGGSRAFVRVFGPFASPQLWLVIDDREHSDRFGLLELPAGYRLLRVEGKEAFALTENQRQGNQLLVTLLIE